MNLTHNPTRCWMQVCRNGHVVSDLLFLYPDRAQSHCAICGAETLASCPTCGSSFAGTAYVPGLVTVGKSRPPAHCHVCGVTLPWTTPKKSSITPGVPALLERLLRRFPLSFHQFRNRHGDRPPFRVADVKDLEDIVRALLPLHFDRVRYECRMPRYSAAARTDFLIAVDDSERRLALTLKFATGELRERAVESELREDIEYYERNSACRSLCCFLYDPGTRHREPEKWELSWSRLPTALGLMCVIAS